MTTNSFAGRLLDLLRKAISKCDVSSSYLSCLLSSFLSFLYFRFCLKMERGGGRKDESCRNQHPTDATALRINVATVYLNLQIIQVTISKDKPNQLWTLASWSTLWLRLTETSEVIHAVWSWKRETDLSIASHHRKERPLLDPAAGTQAYSIRFNTVSSPSGNLQHHKVFWDGNY